MSGTGPFNVVHFSVRDMSSAGGGVRATYAIHQALRQAGCASRLIVAAKAGQDPSVVEPARASLLLKAQMQANAAMHRILLRWARAQTTFYGDVLGAPDRMLLAGARGADILQFHWVAGFVTSGQIRRLAGHTGAPVVWTLMDIGPLTGGCHYAGDCRGYTSRCGCCPQLHSRTRYDLSWWSWRSKRASLQGLPLAVVAPTSWVAARVQESSLFGRRRVARIALPIDPETFRPLDAHVAREVLRLPHDKRVIFFGATFGGEERKGGRQFVEALGHLAQRLRAEDPAGTGGVVVALAGFGMAGQADGLPFATHLLDYLGDQRTLALAYQAADLFVCPSIEDAGPLMIPEAMMCGTPVVAFDAGGAPDLITSRQTGYLARYKDAADLAEGMYALLKSDRLPAMRTAAREAAMRLHAPAVVARQYMDLYADLKRSPGGTRA